MRVVQWSAPERNIDWEESNGFFAKPLDQPWLFHFVTSSLKLDLHAGAFSLKAVLRGEEEYVFGTRRVRLRPGSLMFVPAGREYSSSIISETESLSIFLPAGHCSSFWRDVGGLHEQALDGRLDAPITPMPVACRASAHAWARMQRLAQALAGNGQAAVDESYAFMAAAGESWLQSAPANKPLRRRSTAEELFSRVLRAREMIEDQGGVNCSLEGLANAACLSRFHLLRVFKDFYGCTPGDFARHIRLKRSALLIDAGVNPNLAARQSGYTRVSSLHRAQRRENIS